MSQGRFRPTPAVAIAAGLIAWLLAGVPARAASFTFDGGHTTVTFSWSHAGLSRHSGRIVGAEGTLEFDPASPEAARLEAILRPAKIWTGVPALDRLLRSADFFDSAAEPAVTFKSTGIKPTGERKGEVVGDLTIRGTTRSVTLDVTWNFSGEHPLGLLNPSFSGKFVSGFSATTRIQRSEWGLGRGAPLISDEVEIAIEAEMVRK